MLTSKSSSLRLTETYGESVFSAWSTGSFDLSVAAMILLTGIKGSNVRVPSERERESDRYRSRQGGRENQRRRNKSAVISSEITAIQRRKKRMHGSVEARRYLERLAVGASLSWGTDNLQYTTAPCVIPSDVIQGGSDVTTMLTWLLL